MQSLESARDHFIASVLPLAGGEVDREGLRKLILRSLWGNVADLSMSGGCVDGTMSGQAAKHTALVDDSERAADLLMSGGEGSQVVLVTDNCGLEFLSDLVLVDGLLRTGVAKVVLHCKDTPVFVSDVTPEDVSITLAWLEKQDDACGKFAQTVQGHIDSGRLEVFSHSFYTTSEFFPKLPLDLSELLAAAKVVVVKGDANYRRIVFDAHWDLDFPWQQLVAEVAQFPAPLLALRTCKSGVAAGIPKDCVEQAFQVREDWQTSGTFGLVQLAIP